MSLASTVAYFAGQHRQILRFEFADGSARNIDHGEVKFRVADPQNIDPLTLYQLSGLDPHRFVWDLPTSARGTGSSQTGTRGNRTIGGFAFRRGPDGKADGAPVCKVVWATQGEKFPDVDPQDRSYFERF